MHYPMLEKPGAQNKTVCENQGKQRELSDHWKLKKKKTFLKITGWCKKDKKIDWNTSFNKKKIKRIFKKTNVTQVFKPINYWEITTNTQAN